jgi:two-component system, OmpR family, lantibiotic biosynthesis response regulator NisR/SpaR
MKTILIIDDEKDMVRLLQDTLEGKGYNVFTADDGDTGILLARKQPDLIILDIMMPGTDGFEVCRQIRDVVLCPILFLSAKQYEQDRIKSLAIGGDDYIGKPFSLLELLAKIEAHLRREERAMLLNAQGGRRLLHFKNATVDLQSRQLRVNEHILPLTKKEFDIAEFLALHPGQVFSKDQMYEKIWGYDAEGDANTVAEHVKNIRAKIAEADRDATYISTVWGIGYKWEKS